MDAVPECPAELIVVHVGFGLALTPAARHLVRVRQLELAVRALPWDAGRIALVVQQLQEELPQLYLSGAMRHKATRGGTQHLVRVYNTADLG